MVLVLAYFPAAPDKPPSASALAKLNEKPPPFFRGVANAGSSLSFMLLAAAGGSLNGVFNTWSGSFDQVLPPLDPVPSCAKFPEGVAAHTINFTNGSIGHVSALPPCQLYTQDVCGWIGFVATIAVIVGGFAGGALGDAVLAPRRIMKPFLVGAAVLMVPYLSL